MNAEPLPSQHFEGALSEIRVNAEAAVSYRSLTQGSRFDDGSLIVEWLRLPPTSTSDVVLALERNDGSWHYWQVDSLGRGNEELEGGACQGCHAGALSPPLFGLPQAGGARESKPTAPRSSR